MTTTKVEEIVPGTQWFKVRTDYDDFTQYEVQNDSSIPVEATFNFFDLDNIKWIMGTQAVQVGDYAFQVVVPANSKVCVVELSNEDPSSDKWHYDYQLEARQADVPTKE